MTSKGRRVSTETAYLTPEVLARPNLTVAIEATVTRVVFDTSGEFPRASAVEFTRTKDGPRYMAGARREVVIWWVYRFFIYFVTDESYEVVVHCALLW